MILKEQHFIYNTYINMNWPGMYSDKFNKVCL